MPIISGQTAQSVPFTSAVAMVEVKQHWADEWEAAPEAELMNASASSAGHDLSACEVRTLFGSVKNPWSAIFETIEPKEWSGWWMRITLIGDQAESEIFVGQVVAEARESLGGDTGRQTWVAYGPLHLLRKISISKSVFVESAETREIDWMPAFNDRDERRGRRMLVGNRSGGRWPSPGGLDTYVFAGTDVWTNEDAVEYLLAWYAEQSGGPTWSLGGQREALRELKTVTEPAANETLAGLLERLIPPTAGLDFVIATTDTGFEVRVFSLSADNYTFSGGTIGANPSTTEMDTGSDLTVQATNMVRTAEHRYSKIRVVGQRIIVVTTLRADTDTPSLIPGWSAALETEYIAAAGATTRKGRDTLRAAEKFRPVYQLFKIDSNWDASDVTPVYDAAGVQTAHTGGASQNYHRRILAWLPMFEGYDYSTDPPSQTNAAMSKPDFLPPMAWIYDDDEQRYVPIEDKGISLSLLKNEMGVFLQATPNHRLGKGSFNGSSDHDAEYDWRRLVLTIAFESDQRLVLEHDLPDGDGSVLDIPAEDGECWVLHPSTVTGIGTDGQLVYPVEPDGSVELRNDADRMAATMAGAIARYQALRNRAQIHVRGLVPWGSLVGTILVLKDGDEEIMKAPITSVSWHSAADFSTVVRTGFSR